jgi:hypothetical protein
MTVSLDLAELPGEPRLCRVGEVEDERLPRVEAVGEQLPVSGHLVLGVVRPVASARHRQGGDETAVAGGMLGDVEDGEEVGLGGVGRCGPEVEILGLRWGAFGRWVRAAGRHCEEDRCEHASHRPREPLDSHGVR